MTLPVSRPVDGSRIGRESPRWWTLLVPCLLTLPVAGWCVLIMVLSGLEGCFDTCMPGIPLITPVGLAEFFLAAASVVMLIVGLAVPAWRRKTLRRVMWAGCALAWLGGGYVAAWSSTHP
jgi:hypothetical protein